MFRSPPTSTMARWPVVVGIRRPVDQWLQPVAEPQPRPCENHENERIQGRKILYRLKEWCIDAYLARNRRQSAALLDSRRCRKNAYHRLLLQSQPSTPTYPFPSASPSLLNHLMSVIFPIQSASIHSNSNQVLVGLLAARLGDRRKKTGLIPTSRFLNSTFEN